MVDFRSGDYIERNIEGMWFTAIVEKVHDRYQSVDVKYLDDGNTEQSVPMNEVRKLTSFERRSVVDENQQNRLASSSSSSGKTTLPRPLAGLVEDDYDVRNSVKPTVQIHDENQILDEAILLNGAENKLAAGGGLRALRYLKK